VRRGRRLQGFLEALQPADGVGEIVPPVQMVLGPCGEDEPVRPAVCGLGGGGHPIDRVPAAVDRVRDVAAEVLDRTAREAGRDRVVHRAGDGRRGVAEAVLEVGRHRERRRGHDGGRMRERVFAADRPVESPQGRGEPAARRRQRLVTDPGQDPGGAGVPRIGQQQRSIAVMQVEEVRRRVSRLLGCGHARTLTSWRRP
jgi:hypothetical protein